MSDDGWIDLDAALATADHDGRPIRFWLRDDDATTVTPALDRLVTLAGEAGLPILLAVIPAAASADLVPFLAAAPHVTPCQHGFAHTNHAPKGERACELGGDRADAAVMQELAEGRARIKALFGATSSDILVPPWNRIRDSLIPDLPTLGYCALSTFAPPSPRPVQALPRLDCDLDIIDWKNGRRGRSGEDLCRRLITLVTEATVSGRPIGLLTHHLVHDTTAWAFLDRFIPAMDRNPSVTFTDAREECAHLPIS